MNTTHIGRRIRALREKARMKQADLAIILGIKDRQTVSTLEAGTRRVTADELIRIVEHFKVSLDDLSNPFLLFESENFSWRQNHVRSDDLNAFERKAGEWIGAYRVLGSARLTAPRKLLANLQLTHQSSYEDAAEAGESVAALLQADDHSNNSLIEAIEEKFGILVLMVDAIPGISGAACHLPELNAILINRNESRGRRQSDLAHELFHILTWDIMKPERVESSEEYWEQSKGRKQQRNERIEHLADNFSCGLLMPSWRLDALPEPREDAEWLNAAAVELGVTASNLKWRLVNSGRAPGMKRVRKEELARVAWPNREAEKPLLFSPTFVGAIGKAIEKGDVSSGRAAKLLDLAPEELGDLFEAHGLERPEELCF